MASCYLVANSMQLTCRQIPVPSRKPMMRTGIWSSRIATLDRWQAIRGQTCSGKHGSVSWMIFDCFAHNAVLSPGLDKNSAAVLECQIFQARRQAIQAQAAPCGAEVATGWWRECCCDV